MVLGTYHMINAGIATAASIGYTAAHLICKDMTGLNAKKIGFEIFKNADQVPGHCLAMPHTWGELAGHYKPQNIINYWQKHPPVLSDTSEYLTLGEYVILRSLDSSSFMPISTQELIHNLSSHFTVSSAPIKTPHVSMNIRWKHIFLASSAISHTFSDDTISGIQQYNTLINKLAPLIGDTRSYLVHCCEMYFKGPLENLAAQVDAKNIRFVMGKFKIANSVPLLAQLFNSPTWKGKLTAIIRLVELFDIDVGQLSTEAMHTISEFILRIASWIMEKTQVGIEFCKNNCGWRKVKDEDCPMNVEYHKREETQEQTKNNLSPFSSSCSTPGCGGDPTIGCSLCVKHFCSKCLPCDCPVLFHHTMGVCDCENNNDCLPRAIAQELDISVERYKDAMFNGMNDMEVQAMYQNCVNTYGWHEIDIGYEAVQKEIIPELKVHNMGTIQQILMAHFVFKVNIRLTTSKFQIFEMRTSSSAPWVFLYFDEALRHYTVDVTKSLENKPHFFLFGLPFTQYSHLDNYLSSLERRNITFAKISNSPSPASTPCVSPPSETTSSSEPPSPKIEPSPSMLKPTPLPNYTEQNYQLCASTLANSLKLLQECSESCQELSTTDSEEDESTAYFTKMFALADIIQSGSSGPQNQDTGEPEVEVPTEEEDVKKIEEPSFWEALKSGKFGIASKMFGGWCKDASKDVIQFFEDSPFVSGLFAIIAGLCNFLGLYVVMPTTKRGIAGLIDRFQNVTKTMHYARNGFKGIMDSVKDVFACFKDFLGIENNSELVTFKKELADALEMCRNMLITAQSKPGKFVNDSKAYLNFKKHYLDMSSMYSRLVKFTDTKELAVLNPIWFALTKTFESLTHIYTKFVNGMNSRVVPVCMYFWGGTNIGKSAVLSHLTNMLNIKLGMNMSSYTISKGNIHWNNFGGHEVIRMDDINSFISPSEGDIDSLHLFNLVTDAPFIPMQAAIPDKGIIANPFFVIGASNLPSLPSNTCISDVKAWERRRHFCVHTSYPAHERNCKDSTRCDHFKGKKLDNFDHLTFRLVDPIMSNTKDSKTYLKSQKTGCEYKAKIIETKSIDVIVKHGHVETLQKIVDMAAGLHRLHMANHQIAFEAAVAAGTMKMEAGAWSHKPVVMLDGPPGTGKSHVFQRFMEHAGTKRALNIRNISEFKIFAHGGFAAPGKDFVVIDDLSLLRADKDAMDFFTQLVNELYNEVKKPPYTLIVGVNRGVLTENLGAETVTQLMRRAHIITSSFRKRPHFDRFLSFLPNTPTLSKFYTEEDVSKNFQLPKHNQMPMVEFVEFREGEKLVTQEQLVKELLKYTPAITVVVSQNELRVRQQVVPTAMCQIDITSKELCEAVMKTKLTTILSLFSSSKKKIFESSNLTVKKIAMALGGIGEKTRAMRGVQFETFDDVLLNARNSLLLEGFKGELCTLILKDRIYYIDYKTDECDAGIVDCGIDAVLEAVRDLRIACSVSNVDMVKSLVSTMFPPWFTLSIDVITTIIMTIAPTVSAMLALQDQQEMYDAYKVVAPFQDIIHFGANRTIDSASSRLAHKVGMPELARNADYGTKLYPGPNHLKTPQQSYICDMDPSLFEGDVTDPASLFLETGPEKNAKASAKANWNTETGPEKNAAKTSSKVQWNSETGPEKNAHSTQKNVAWNEGLMTKHQQRASTMETYFNRPLIDTSLTSPIQEIRTSDKRELHVTGTPEDHKKAIKEVSTDPALYSIVNHLIKNVAEVVDSNGNKKCSGIFIRGRTFSTVLHLEKYTDLNQLRIKTLDGKLWNFQVISRNECYDRLDLFIDDPQFSPRADITKHLPHKSNCIAEGTYAVLVTPNSNVLGAPLFTIRSYCIKKSLYKIFEGEQLGQFVIDYRGHQGGFMLDGPVQTTYGDCGSLLILADPRVNHGKLVGLHTSATSYAAYASPLLADQYADKRKFQVANQSKFSKALFPEPPLDPKGIARSNIPIYIPSKTKLHENWYPLGPKVYEPSVLDGRDPRSTKKSVLYDEAIKWCRPREEFSAEIKQELRDCMTDIASHFVDVLRSKGTVLKTLTSMEAMNKYQGSGHSEPINLHTSAGFPWNINVKNNGKQDYVVTDSTGIRRWNKDNKVGVDKVQAGINRFLDPAQTQNSNSVIFQVFLKDECVKLKKIYEETKTRTIAAAPLDYSIAYRRFNHTLHCAIMDNWQELPIKVGINPTSLDWHTLFTSLSKTSMRAVDLDYKGWDFSAHPFFIDLLAEFYDTLYKNLDPNYTPLDKEIRDGLYSQIKNFFLLIGRTLYRSEGGIPSGYPGTTIDNSLVNFLITYWAFRQIARRRNPKLLNFFSFNQLVTCAIYGDDIVMAVDSRLLQDFNGLSIPDVVARIGFNAQPADKGSTFISDRPLKDCIFLSRGFKFTSGFWIGPLEIDHMLKPSWYVTDSRSHDFWREPHKKCTRADIVTSSYESMVFEAALHSDDVFNMVRDAAMKVYARCKLRIPPTKKECLARLYGDTVKFQTVEGLSFHKCHELIAKYNPPARPPHKKIFHNRVSYSYGPQYKYTGCELPPNKIPNVLKPLLASFNKEFNREWNSILVNEYPIGGEIPYHKDDEPGLDLDHGILGVTIFGDGQIEFKDHNRTIAYFLEPGTAYLMEKDCLVNYHHRRVNHQRATMSLTFRKIDA
uniref:Polyprotein n=1 Tax=Picornavirales sp. TaxID=1955153 RepID=A0A6M9ZAD8_9VIRU|nr:MAG: hypothetical protein 1 [Picornavirales sp.]